MLCSNTVGHNIVNTDIHDTVVNNNALGARVIIWNYLITFGENTKDRLSLVLRCREILRLIYQLGIIDHPATVIIGVLHSTCQRVNHGSYTARR